MIPCEGPADLNRKAPAQQPFELPDALDRIEFWAAEAVRKLPGFGGSRDPLLQYVLRRRFFGLILQIDFIRTGRRRIHRRGRVKQK
jgi:hypothetical protein